MAIKHSRLQVPCAALLLCLGLAGSAWSANKIGYLDMKRLLDHAPQVQANRGEVETEFEPRNNRILADEAELADLEERLKRDAALMTPEQAGRLELEARALQRSVRRAREDLKDEMLVRVNQKRNKLVSSIEAAVKVIAEQQQYDLILYSEVAYASERVDITDQVLAYLSTQFGRNIP